ncbi:hypothetical protein [Nocardia sp. NRRL S-836]|uniref:hypothetical protein n=1 Tax=Nocardia sp. NRRL S-836 TaxID=1519492 RepID=UPI0006AD875A|nr:hypothetical protein [Nocardia sp. NRRL S-836]KOV80905.1 hypothetical protein ADL03_30720 [Nocardia sp. NRRL S-836]
MTDPQNPWQNPEQWQQPTGQYQASQYQASQYQPGQYPVDQHPAGQYPPTSQYQVQPVHNPAWSMTPLNPVLPEEMAPPRPATITAAMWTWIAAAVLAIAVLPVLILGNAASLIGDSTVTAEDRSAAELGVTSLAVFAGFGMLVAAAPYVAFAVVLRNGHSWARILLTILGALGVPTMIGTLLFALNAPAWQPGVVLSVLVLGLTVAAVVLQFLPASNRYVR